MPSTAGLVSDGLRCFHYSEKEQKRATHSTELKPQQERVPNYNYSQKAWDKEKHQVSFDGKSSIKRNLSSYYWIWGIPRYPTAKERRIDTLNM